MILHWSFLFSTVFEILVENFFFSPVFDIIFRK